MGSARRLTFRGWLVVALQLVLLAIVVLARGDSWYLGKRLRRAGWVLSVTGITVMGAGSMRLGRAISAHPAPARGAVLRTDGPYRFVRHPIYSGLILLSGGIAATSSSVVSLAAWAALVLTLRVKSGYEERLLKERFPGYAAYARATARFVPRFRRQH